MAEPDAIFTLRREMFGEREREIVRFGDLSASAFRYDTGVEAIRLKTPRGEAVVLPFMGQMLWSAEFDRVQLGMRSLFAAPRPVATIIETYGCLAYHSGLLRNGVPGAGDTHPLHGEAPCAPMDAAQIVCGADSRGRFLAIAGARTCRPRRWTSCICATSISLFARARGSCSRFRSRRSMSSRALPSPAT